MHPSTQLSQTNNNKHRVSWGTMLISFVHKAIYIEKRTLHLAESLHMSSFVFEFKLSFGLISLWQDPILARIENDIEECSTVSVCRYIMCNHKIQCYPIQNSGRYFYMASSGPINLVQSVLHDTGLHIDIDCPLPPIEGSQSGPPFSMQQAILFLIYHNCLLMERFYAIASITSPEYSYYELQFGCRTKSNKGFLIYGFERCVLTSTCRII
jgi:hypothetical protein